jgi:hypothetical protein
MGVTATGNVKPLRFLIASTTTDNQVTQASGTSSRIVGISGPGTRYPPWSALDDGFHAIAGENVEVFKPPMKEAYLQLGGTVTAGDLLTSDSDGQGVTGTTGQQTGARAMQAGVSGQSILVQPLWGDVT